MKRQALYRLEWDDADLDGDRRPPARIPLTLPGPWHLGTNLVPGSAYLIYEGPLGRTTITTEYREPELEGG